MLRAGALVEGHGDLTTASRTHCQPLLVVDHFEYAAVRLRQLDFRSASEAHGCHAALDVRAAQSAINGPHAILQHRSKGPFGFDLFFPIDRNQHSLSYLNWGLRIGDETIFRSIGLCLS